MIANVWLGLVEWVLLVTLCYFADTSALNSWIIDMKERYG